MDLKDRQTARGPLTPVEMLQISLAWFRKSAEIPAVIVGSAFMIWMGTLPR